MKVPTTDSTTQSRQLQAQRAQRQDLAGGSTRPTKEKKTHEALFGPNIGVVSSGPAWTAASEKKVLTDELTPDVVTNWVAKSKDASQPTTTLQALVNLKRPTLRLSPLTSEDSTADHHHHGLEFEYDCDAPKCGIYVHILLPKDHPDAPSTTSSSGLSKFLVFESVVDGGFGKLLTLEEGALLELGRFEHTPASAPESSSTGDNSTTADSNVTANRNARRRFTHLPFRKRTQNHSISGPALRVVDADPTPATDDKNKDDIVEGVRVTIRLAALDAQGTELASPNEQVTYLHVVRFGTAVEGEIGDEDSRPWVVRVAKREATIGPHTFHLHEIYGLTSQSTTVPAPAHIAEHTYPPPATPSDSQTPFPMPLPPVAEDDPQSECLLCLSSPREVVLLPCRHLVACKECALNMVEFGAGGTISQATEPEAAAEAPPAATPSPTVEGDAAPADTPATAPAPVLAPAPAPGPNPNARRKRKAKGWFCPVCRQPYTSLLRITTQPPPPKEQADKEAAAEEATAAEAANTAGASDGTRSGGLLTFTPAFFRGLSFSRAVPNDVESQAGTARVGA
ncbi:hypothetical protein DXG01_015015 [Tephrocybe rancida]|nr:hypothetical protein DXG01_015015 [Tephrocybe rancida]